MSKRRNLLTKTLISGLTALAVSAPFLTNTQTAFAGTGGKTASNAITWVKSKVGTGIDFDKVYGNQCVDLIKAYYAYLGQSQPYGNGSGYTSNALPSGWKRYKGVQPKKGDVLVYTGGYGGYGHVAIYESDYSHYHQNWNSHSYVERVTYKYNGNFGVTYWGVIRPDFAAEKTSAGTSKTSTISVTGVSLNKTSATLAPGEGVSLKATIKPSNATNKKVTWSSSNTKVAKVDSNGKVKAYSAGTAVITAKTADGSKTAKSTITVKLPSNGLAKTNGVWRYYVNGKINTTYTGLAKNLNGWWYVKKGVIDYTYTGMAKSPKTHRWYYVKKGKVDYTYTGLAKSPKTGKLYYMKKGVLDYSYNGTVTYNGKTYTVKKGVATLKK